jgi:hypothetical protein
MKNVFGFILIVTQLSCSCQSNNELDFNVHYKPLLIYNLQLIQNSHTEVLYKCSEDILIKLKEAGYNNPEISDDKKEILSVVKTGKLSSSDNFPFIMEMISTNSSSGKKDLPDGTRIYGNCNIESVPVIDSVAANNISDDYKIAIKQALQNTFSQITFPKRKLKIGEQYTREAPVRIPAAGMTVDMVIKTVYKLLTISKDSAVFDISQEYTVNANASKQILMATGQGSGKLVYDINNNYYNFYQINTTMNFQISVKTCVVEMKMNSDFIQNVKISNK